MFVISSHSFSFPSSSKSHPICFHFFPISYTTIQIGGLGRWKLFFINETCGSQVEVLWSHTIGVRCRGRCRSPWMLSCVLPFRVWTSSIAASVSRNVGF
ncbi:unnamed protein product [Lactuca virosa]|uniref:Uncharacterized protein n=1 Tax=Lactuca virosa TaxID=75947 RepID=A0AAU9N036_9ASTR|nr:unnamed protein product [Lactuca virosa]